MAGEALSEQAQRLLDTVLEQAEGREHVQVNLYECAQRAGLRYDEIRDAANELQRKGHMRYSDVVQIEEDLG